MHRRIERSKRTLHFVSSGVGRAMRNALSLSDPAVSLKRREGSSRVPAGTVETVAECRAQGRSHFLRKWFGSHLTHQKCGVRMRTLECPDGHFRPLEGPGCCWVSVCYPHTFQGPVKACFFLHVCSRAYDVCGSHTRMYVDRIRPRCYRPSCQALARCSGGRRCGQSRGCIPADWIVIRDRELTGGQWPPEEMSNSEPGSPAFTPGSRPTPASARGAVRRGPSAGRRPRPDPS